jgi:hypothetical protein
MYLCALTGGTGHCCNGACTNTEFDRTNCGTCGTVCAAGTWCNYGTCVAQVACDPLVSGAACEISSTHSGRCCGGSCVDPTTDATNCSQCGNVCPLGATCVDASCEKADGTTASCHTDGCPAGLLCNYYACWSPTCAPGASGGVCAFGPTRTGTCCDGACVDVQQDEANCGQCGNGCSGGLCVGGTCFSNTATTSSHQTCSGYYDTCPANERCDPISDQCVNCSDWGYGDFCYSPMQCSQGRCVVTTCSNAMPGTEACADTASTFIGICCGGYFNPQCANIMTDTSNCGECDRKCPTGATCVGGECSTTPPACAAGHHAAYCALDGGAANVCCTEGCVDLTRTDTSCGGCGYACSAGLSCVGSSCIALACTTALEGQSCGRDGGNGTCCSSSCVDRETDATNCGSCGHVCSATMTCKGGGCGLDACDASHVGSKCHFTDTQLGLCCPAGCVDTTSDSQNCGGCGAPCPGSTTCQNGACHA